MAENNCVVCFKTVRIYSVGECDHPVCYECSTRMRVLCRQNECPMCRHEMDLVVFTEKIRPFRRLKRNYYLYDKKHSIVFENDDIQEAYQRLLYYVCTKCQREPIFDTLEILNEHMKKVHDLYCCNLCADNLKIFPAESRYYTKSELGRHKRIGDIDNRSHRGHPLCEFCNVRYIDRDELYKHLRKEHLFCHICDSEGIQQFYGMYDMLRDHYKKDHFLCEEGDCIQEQLTSVFPTEIDLKAHVALVHCKNFRNRQAVKQARTLELEFTLAPRHSNERRGRLANHERSEEASSNHHISQNQIQENQAENKLASWDHDFPSLTNSAMFPAPRPNFTQKKNNQLAFNEENFPALGTETNVQVNFTSNLDSRPSTSGSVACANISVQVNHSKGKPANRMNSKRSSNAPSSSTLSLTWVEKAKEKKPPPNSRNHQPTPTPAEAESKPPSMNRKNFPKLQNAIVGEPIESVKKNKKSSVSIHIDESDNQRPHINYCDVTNSKNNQKKTDEKKAIPSTSKSKEKINDTQISNKDVKTQCFLLNANRKKVKMKPEAFTTLNSHVNNVDSLPTSSSSRPVPCSDPSNVSVKTVKSKNRDNLAVVQLSNLNCDNKINDKKIANADKKSKPKEKLNNSSTSKENESEKKSNKGKENFSQKMKDDNEKRKLEVQFNDKLTKDSSKSGNDKKVTKNEDKSKPNRIKSELNIGPLSESGQNKTAMNESTCVQKNDESTSMKMRKPPPGFDKPITPPPPPPGFVPIRDRGYQNSMIDTHPTFNNIISNSLFAYQQPKEFVSRNSQLIKKITRSLVKNTEEALDDFKNTSLLFREGIVSASVFYLYCRKNIKSEYFEDVFIDLITLLPNILKQQELWTVHRSTMPENSNANSSIIESCQICLQILKLDDITSHYAEHGVTTEALLQCSHTSK